METAAPAPSVRSRSTGRYVAASLVGLLALLLGAAGGAGLWARYGASDHGWITSGTHRYAASGRAIVSGSLDADGIPNWLVAKARITASSDNGRPLFVGVARSADVDRYLAGVAHSEVVDVNANPFGTTYRPSYRERPGGKPATPPDRATFWVASVAGQGSEALTWSVKRGRWAVVVMRPDGSRGVSADLAAGAKLPALLWASIVVFVVGLLILGGAAALIYFGARERHGPAPPVGPNS